MRSRAWLSVAVLLSACSTDPPPRRPASDKPSSAYATSIAAHDETEKPAAPAPLEVESGPGSEPRRAPSPPAARSPAEEERIRKLVALAERSGSSPAAPVARAAPTRTTAPSPPTTAESIVDPRELYGELRLVSLTCLAKTSSKELCPHLRISGGGARPQLDVWEAAPGAVRDLSKAAPLLFRESVHIALEEKKPETFLDALADLGKLTLAGVTLGTSLLAPELRPGNKPGATPVNALDVASRATDEQRVLLGNESAQYELRYRVARPSARCARIRVVSVHRVGEQGATPPEVHVFIEGDLAGKLRAGSDALVDGGEPRLFSGKARALLRVWRRLPPRREGERARVEKVDSSDVTIPADELPIDQRSSGTKELSFDLGADGKYVLLYELVW